MTALPSLPDVFRSTDGSRSLERKAARLPGFKDTPNRLSVFLIPSANGLTGRLLATMSTDARSLQKPKEAARGADEDPRRLQRKKISQELFPGLGQHGFRMELHTF